MPLPDTSHTRAPIDFHRPLGQNRAMPARTLIPALPAPEPAPVLSRRAVLGGVGALVLLPGCSLTGSGTGAYDPVNISQGEAASAINAIRRQHGLAELSPNGTLLRLAKEQAGLMARHDLLTHEVTKANSFRNRMVKASYGGNAGENLSAGRRDLASALRGWMNSAGHRKNMLNPNHRDFGIAAARVAADRQSRYGIYWALVLGGPPPPETA